MTNDFPVWKTIKLGTGLKTGADFRKALKQKKFRLSDWALNILDEPAFTINETEIEVCLVLVSVAGLGFPNGAKRSEVYIKAQSLGLHLCSPEVGPQLRLQYTDQPLSEWILIGMEPIMDSYGNFDVFNVECYKHNQWLSGYYDRPDYFWIADSRLAFTLSK